VETWLRSLTMRVLITGGAGFIGSHLVRRMLELGHEVRILDSFATGRRENLADLDGPELVEGDIQSYERVHTASLGCEVVLHEAALPSVPRSVQDPLMTNVVNVTGTLNALLAARDNDVRRVVYASSSSVYGPGEVLPKEESLPPAPISPYAVSKLAGEGYCRAFSAIYGLECVALRYFNVFGPRQDPKSQYAAVIPKFIQAALDGRRPPVYGDGEQSRDFTYVDNVVDANLRAIESTTGVGEVFNVACGERITLNEVLVKIGALLGTSLEADYLPTRQGEIPHSMANIDRARATLGYEPAVSFDEGLRRTLEHLVASRSPRSALTA
jgi:nucleoside-diphosphate-sugar epimerase